MQWKGWPCGIATALALLVRWPGGFLVFSEKDYSSVPKIIIIGTKVYPCHIEVFPDPKNKGQSLQSFQDT